MILNISIKQFYNTFFKKGGTLDIEKYMRIVPDFFDVEPQTFREDGLRT